MDKNFSAILAVYDTPYTKNGIFETYVWKLHFRDLHIQHFFSFWPPRTITAKILTPYTEMFKICPPPYTKNGRKFDLLIENGQNFIKIAKILSQMDKMLTLLSKNGQDFTHIQKSRNLIPLHAKNALVLPRYKKSPPFKEFDPSIQYNGIFGTPYTNVISVTPIQQNVIFETPYTKNAPITPPYFKWNSEDHPQTF